MENEIVEAVCAAPQLLKLGIALEFRDALNKTAIQLLKNLDRSKCSPYTGTECLFKLYFVSCADVRNSYQDTACIRQYDHLGMSSVFREQGASRSTRAKGCSSN